MESLVLAGPEPGEIRQWHRSDDFAVRVLLPGNSKKEGDKRICCPIQEPCRQSTVPCCEIQFHNICLGWQELVAFRSEDSENVDFAQEAKIIQIIVIDRCGNVRGDPLAKVESQNCWLKLP